MDEEEEQDKSDRLYKVRPFLERIQQNFAACAESELINSIDEMMIPFKVIFMAIKFDNCSSLLYFTGTGAVGILFSLKYYFFIT